MGALIVATNDYRLSASFRPLAARGQLIVDWRSYKSGFFDSSLQAVEALIIDQSSIGEESAEEVARWRAAAAPLLVAIHILDATKVVNPRLLVNERDEVLILPVGFFGILKTLDKIKFHFDFDRASEFPKIDLNLQRSSVLINQKEIALTKNEFCLFSILFKASGTVVTYDAIAHAIWSGDDGSRKKIACLLSDLRGKMTLTIPYFETTANRGIMFSQA